MARKGKERAGAEGKKVYRLIEQYCEHHLYVTRLKIFMYSHSSCIIYSQQKAALHCTNETTPTYPPIPLSHRRKIGEKGKHKGGEWTEGRKRKVGNRNGSRRGDHVKTALPQLYGQENVSDRCSKKTWPRSITQHQWHHSKGFLSNKNQLRL